MIFGTNRFYFVVFGVPVIRSTTYVVLLFMVETNCINFYCNAFDYHVMSCDLCSRCNECTTFRETTVIYGGESGTEC